MNETALFKKLGELANECREWILNWRKKNIGLTELPLYNPKFSAMAARLHGFLMAMFLAEIINDEQVKKIWSYAVQTPISSPTEMEKFIKGLNELDDL